MTIDSVMQWSGAWLLTYAIHSTLLLGAAAIFAGRRTNRLPLLIRDTIWKAALIGGVATATLQNVAGIRPWFKTTGTDDQESVLMPELTRAELPASTSTESVVGEDGIQASTPVPVAVSVAAGNEDKPFNWVRFLLILWIAGAAFGVLRLLLARARLVRLLSGRREVTDSELLSALTNLRRQATISRPLNLSQSEHLPTAVALRNEICLPERVFSELKFEHRHALLAHEVAHVARRDAWWLTVSLIIEHVFFFQPLNRVARSQLQEIAEFLCDDWAVSSTGRHLTFAECLAEVAGWIVQGGYVPQNAPGFAHRNSRLVQRVERVLAPRSSTRGGHMITRISVAAAALLAFGFSAPGLALVREAPALEPLPSDVREEAVPGTPTPVADVDQPPPSAASSRPTPPASRRTSESAFDSSKPTRDRPAVQDTIDSRVVQSLVNALDDEEATVRREAAQALGELRAVEAIPALVSALSDQDESVRRESVEALARIRNPDALDGLIVALRDQSASVRSEAIETIVSIVRNDETGARESLANQVAPAIAALLNDPSPGVRREAISATLSLGNRDAVSTITGMLRDSTPEVRRSAAQALGRFEDPVAVTALSRAVRDSSAGVRYAAIRSLSRFPSAADVVPALSSALQDSNAEVREAAVSALGDLENAGSVDALIPTLRDTDSDVRLAALRALADLEARGAVGAISDLLDDPSSDVREMAVRALGELGDSTSLNTVLPALRDSVADVWAYGIRSAARLGGTRAAPPIRDMLNDPSPEVREFAARMLGDLEDQGSIPALISALSDSHADVRQAAVRALAEIESPAAADGFVEALDDEDSDVRRYAVRGLASLNDSRFVEPLIAALSDGSSSVRADAASALGRLRDIRARDALIAATEDPDSDVRRAAIRALSRIR